MLHKPTRVAQVWYTNPEGEEYAYTNKFYSKIGVAENLVQKYNLSSSWHFFVRIYSIEHLGDIGK